METIWILLAVLIGLVVAAGWVACVVYVYVDAQKRRVDSPLLWAFGTLCVGPVGLVAYLVDRPRAPRVQCPYCGQPILATDRQCPYCGRGA